MVSATDARPADAFFRHMDTKSREDHLGAEMDRQIAGVLYGVVMAAVIVGVDVAFFKGRFWERLMVNVGIVLVFGAFYLRFFRPS
jgi:hypothetical protein